jgi:hypothetical protein
VCVVSVFVSCDACDVQLEQKLDRLAAQLKAGGGGGGLFNMRLIVLVLFVVALYVVSTWNLLALVIGR